MTKPIELTVVCDGDSNECLYTDGAAWPCRGCTAVYAGDLAEAADRQPVLIRHECVEWVHDEWPDRLEDALTEPVEAEPRPSDDIDPRVATYFLDNGHALP